jgi:glycosyltransferase involved in cell wall biosynthesis
LKSKKKIIFNVIIPTKNRCKTLRYTLKTLTNQNYKNLRIVILDNNSKDNTKSLIKHFKDKRIKYFNSKKNLSMSQNWERCFKYIKTGYTTILGDDDGFMPNTFNKLNKILSNENINILKWVQHDYFWKNFKDKSNFANIKFSNNKKEIEIIESTKILRQILDMNLSYTESPMIYNSFIKTKILKKIKKDKKIFFLSGIPDVYSGLLFLLKFQYFYKLNSAITINGISSFSGGALISKKNKRRSDIVKNHKLARIRLVPPIPSYYLSILDPFLALTKEYRKITSKYLINYFLLKSRVISEIKNEHKADYKIYLKDLTSFINDLKKNYSTFTKIIIFLRLFSPQKYYTENTISIKVPNNIDNIFLASQYLEKKNTYYLSNKNNFIKNVPISNKILNFLKQYRLYNIFYTIKNFKKIFN